MSWIRRLSSLLHKKIKKKGRLIDIRMLGIIIVYQQQYSHIKIESIKLQPKSTFLKSEKKYHLHIVRSRSGGVSFTLYSLMFPYETSVCHRSCVAGRKVATSIGSIRPRSSMVDRRIRFRSYKPIKAFQTGI